MNQSPDRATQTKFSKRVPARRKLINVLSVGAIAACIMLTSEDAQAACSDSAKTFLSASSAVAGYIPLFGSATSTGASLANLFVCGGGGEPLNADSVTGLIRDELDSQTAVATQERFDAIVDDVRRLDEFFALFGDASLSELNLEQALDLSNKVDTAVTSIREAEVEFFAVFNTHNDSRAEYDLGPVIAMANYKLMYSTLLREGTGFATLGSDESERILGQTPAYRVEADRLREMDVNLTHKQFGTGLGALHQYRGQVHRDGILLFEGQIHECRFSTGCDAIARAQGEATDEVVRILKELDGQARQLDLLEAKAKAWLADPFVDLGTVTPAEPPPSVLIGSRHSSVNDKCLMLAEGRLNDNGNLQEGEIRLATCDTTSARQRWKLQDDGQIRSEIANLCIDATSHSNKVFATACDSGRKRQKWTRRQDRLEVVIDGSRRCMKKRKHRDIMRHSSCDSSESRQKWLTFSQLRNGRSEDFVGFGAYSPEAAEILGVEFDEDNLELEAGGGLCASTVNSLSVQLSTCDRYASRQYWAEDAAGRLRPMNDRDRALDLSIQGQELRTSSNTGTSVTFTRDEFSDGTFLMLNHALDFVFAGVPEEGARLFADALPLQDNGDPVEFSLWRHFNGGLFAN